MNKQFIHISLSALGVVRVLIYYLVVRPHFDMEVSNINMTRI